MTLVSWRVRGVVALLLLTAGRAVAQATVTQDEALGLAFPGAELERRTAFLDETDLERLRELAGREVEFRNTVWTYYVAHEGGEQIGVAYFDVHRVRTLPEVLMVVVGPDGVVGRVEVLKFTEPPEYRAPEGWLEQFDGAALTPAMSLDGDIAAMTGATLTARAITEAVRRVLALHQLIAPLGALESGAAR